MMRKVILLLASMAAAVLLATGVALATSVNEEEPNGGYLCCAGAQNIDDYFSLDEDPNITDRYGTENTSTTVPHATINGTGDDTYDYYSFTVPEAGGTVTIDVDGAHPGFDSIIRLYDSVDAEQQNNNGFITASDDSNYSDPGSLSSKDSALAYPLSAGTYYVKVGSYFDNTVPTGASYTLHVSIPNHPVDTTAPTVSSVTPTQTTKVPLTATISATFSEEMKTSTLDSPATNFKLQKLTGKGKNATYMDVSGVGVTSEVSTRADGTKFTTATLTPPDSRLAANSSYKAIVTTGVTDQAGNARAQEKVWNFKTGGK